MIAACGKMRARSGLACGVSERDCGCCVRGLAWSGGSKVHCGFFPHPADEQMYRCEDCDELFPSKPDLRRHQKYSCSSASSLFDALGDDFKQEREDSDEAVHECKDCEKIFPNEYRSARPPPSPSAGKHCVMLAFSMCENHSFTHDGNILTSEYSIFHTFIKILARKFHMVYFTSE